MPRLTRRGALVSVALVLNLSAWDFGAALGGAAEKPDSLGVQAPQDSVSAADSLAREIAPPATKPEAVRLYEGDLSDGQGNANRTAPVYRKWWFWSIVGGVLLSAAVIGAGRGDEARPNLPDFPDPPER